MGWQWMRLLSMGSRRLSVSFLSTIIMSWPLSHTHGDTHTQMCAIHIPLTQGWRLQLTFNSKEKKSYNKYIVLIKVFFFHLDMLPMRYETLTSPQAPTASRPSALLWESCWIQLLTVRLLFPGASSSSGISTHPSERTAKHWDTHTYLLKHHAINWGHYIRKSMWTSDHDRQMFLLNIPLKM